jgi:hypothetical protein
MQRVFTAATLLEAHLVQQMLEAEFIPAAVFNENAQGAIGELPVTDAWPDVWIVQNHQFRAARAVIERYEASSENELLCNSCGEISPGSFEVCWQCHAVLPTQV